MQHLSRHRERLAAGGEDLQAREAFQQRLHEVRGGVDEVLAVVEHEQELAVRERGEQTGGRVGLDGNPGHDLGGADGVQNGRRQLVRASERGQLGDPAFTRAGPDDLAGEPRLPGAARTGQGDQPARREQAGDPADVGRAADEARERGRCGARSGRAAQHGEPGRAQIRAGIDTELVGQPVAGAVEHGQRLDLPAGGVQAPGEHGCRGLAEGLGGEQRGEGVELGRGLTQAPRGLGGQLDGGRVQPLEPDGGRFGEGQRRTSASAGPRRSAVASTSRVRACPGSSPRAAWTSDSARSASTSRRSTANR
ncbi:MAG TPA: hypothetical protein VLK57_06415 [Pseudonocardia sp.]|nr:hypothetical protein [Pseudonocardia sp.]